MSNFISVNVFVSVGKATNFYLRHKTAESVFAAGQSAKSRARICGVALLVLILSAETYMKKQSILNKSA
jgi:hypothetical protein